MALTLRGGVRDVQHGFAGPGQPQLSGGHPLPGHAVPRRPDHRLRRAATGVIRRSGARGQEAVGGLGDHPDGVAGQLWADPVGGGESPGQAARAGPDGLRADRHPAARAAGQQRGLVTGCGLAAAGRADRGELPAGTGVRRDQELLADHAVAGLRAHRHDRVACGHDAVDGLEDPALLLSGIGVEGDRAQRQPRRDDARGPVLVRGQRAELRPVAGQQRKRQDGHGHQHDGRHRDRRGTAAEQAAAGPLGARHPVVEQEGVVRPRPAGLAPPGDQAGRTLPDGRPVVAPPVVPVRAVVLVDPWVGEHGRAERDRHLLGPAGLGRVVPVGIGRVAPVRVGRALVLPLRRGRALVLRLRRGRALLPLDAGLTPELVGTLPRGRSGRVRGGRARAGRRCGTAGLESGAARPTVQRLGRAQRTGRRLRRQR